MATPTITEYLKYANLQMAAEAFMNIVETGEKLYSGEDLKRALIAGNNHASRFTAPQAQAFVDQWEVVDQRANTKTGFSGTLFRNKANPNDLVLSFRSTEFIDDAIRDSAATNSLEVFGTGWAWGQMADMEAWYKELTSTNSETGESGALLGKTFSVTGYSLGGHLATAFNLLRREEAALGPMPATLDQVVTFNGAGVGEVKTGTLAQALGDFQTLRESPAAIQSRLGLVTPELVSFYQQLQTNLKNGTWTAAQAMGELTTLGNRLDDTGQSLPSSFEAEKAPLYKALTDIITLQNERARIAGFIAGGNGPDAASSPKTVPAGEILAETLDYRLAVYFASQNTNRKLSIFSKTPPPAGQELANQYDLVGIETTTGPWSAVANSGVHYGANVDLFIEDQPLTRGDFVENLVRSLMTGFELDLLQDKYAVNNFADNHSLVLMVDSLNVQNTLLNLLPEQDRSLATNPQSALGKALQNILKDASWYKAESQSGTQGKAEGDVLENIANALADFFLGPAEKAKLLKGCPDGNTWATADTPTFKNAGLDYTGRDKFYEKLNAVADSEAYKTLAGTLITNGNDPDQNGSGQKGDWINGGADNDALFGGEGRDILIGGAGDDDINGDDDFTATEFTWTITDPGTVSGGAKKLRSTAIQLISNDNNWRQAA